MLIPSGKYAQSCFFMSLLSKFTPECQNIHITVKIGRQWKKTKSGIRTEIIICLYILTKCGLVTSYDDIELDQYDQVMSRA